MNYDCKADEIIAELKSIYKTEWTIAYKALTGCTPSNGMKNTIDFLGEILKVKKGRFYYNFSLMIVLHFYAINGRNYIKYYRDLDENISFIYLLYRVFGTHIKLFTNTCFDTIYHPGLSIEIVIHITVNYITNYVFKLPV